VVEGFERGDTDRGDAAKGLREGAAGLAEVGETARNRAADSLFL
jgi:hypothetical protein